MRKSAVVISVFALIAGIIGYLLRSQEVNTVFESVTGLAERNALVTVILISLSALVIVLAVVFAVSISSRYKAENAYTQAFKSNSFIYFAVSFLIGMIWLAAAVIYFFSQRTSGVLTVIDVVFVFLALLSAVSVIVLAHGTFIRRSGNEMMLFSVIPSLFFCFWLVILYKDNAANPVLLSFGYQSLAIAACALSYYFSAGFAFGKAVTGRAVFTYIVTIFFCIVVLADPISLPVKLIFVITVVNMLMSTLLFINNLKSRNAH